MKLTPWFDGGSVPSRPGVYRRQLPSENAWSYWACGLWGVCARTPLKAAEAFDVANPSAYQRAPWRGLAEEAK
jgi:hypothetical protein